MKTLESYDQVPYQGYAIAETHPDRLAAIGRLFGLDPAPPERSRVLELGAAAGGNLIPMAFNLPHSRFTGVELSGAQAWRGQQMIAELRLANARMLHRDILELPIDPDADLGTFDYILAHGVWSWAPRPVRAHILALCAGLLAPGGIAYVSYNVLPGWRQRGMLRDMLLHVTREEASPDRRLARARKLLEQLEAALAGEQRPEAQTLLREVRYLRNARASYLFHEYLEEINEPELFSAFVARANAAGLQYLADADLYTMFPETLGKAAAQVLSGIETLSATEQLMDFISLRPFRRTLLVRSDAMIEREIDLNRLFTLRPYADLEPEGKPRPDASAQVYRNPAGEGFDVSHPLTKSMLARLRELYPNAIGLTDLLEAARHEVRAAGNHHAANETRDALGELFNLYCSGAIGFSSLDAVWPSRIGSHPRATPLALTQAAAGEGHAAGVRHRVVSLDPLSERLLFLMDGSRDLDALVADILRSIEADPQIGAPLGKSIRDRRTRSAVIRANIERLLRLFVRNGLLRAS